MRRLLTLIFLSLSIVVAAQSCSEDPDLYNLKRYASANQMLRVAPDVVFIGNSITDHWYRDHAAFFHKHNIAGRGISGQTSGQIRGRFVADVVELHPKAVVILAGINDLAHNAGWVDPDGVFDNIRAMCIRAIAAGITPFIASITPADHIAWNPSITGVADDVRALNKRLREYATAAGIGYVDYYSALDTDGDGAMDPGLSDDGLHPLPDTYTIMESIVLPHLAPYLSTPTDISSSVE